MYFIDYILAEEKDNRMNIGGVDVTPRTPTLKLNDVLLFTAYTKHQN
jgi:hypothetical protein